MQQVVMSYCYSGYTDCDTVNNVNERCVSHVLQMTL